MLGNQGMILPVPIVDTHFLCVLNITANQKYVQNVRRKIMKYTKSYIEMRIEKLKGNPVENAKLIKKWERMLRRVV